MNDMFNVDKVPDEYIVDINKFNIFVSYARDMTHDDLDILITAGYLKDGCYDEIKMALQYFLTVATFDEGFSAYGYKKTLNEFLDNPKVDLRGRKIELSYLNEGVIRALYDMPMFNRLKQLEHNARVVEISQMAINDIAEEPDNKEYLGTLKAVHSIAKENQEHLRNNREIVLLHIPSESFFKSYELLLRSIDKCIGEVSKINPTMAMEIKGALHEDKFIREEDATTVYALSNLQN